MVDAAFYRESYLGSLIPDSRFPELAARAAEALEQLKRCFRVTGGEQEEAMAICAMAECLFRESKRCGIKAATAGNVSVQYSAETGLFGKLYRAAGVYLEFYRGV